MSDDIIKSRRCLMSWAVEHGYFSVFLWAHQQWCSFNAGLCMDLAARNGRLDILQWLWSHDYPLYSQLCVEAIQGGHLHVLQWLRKQECPWNKQLCAWFAEVSHKNDVLEWIDSQ